MKRVLAVIAFSFFLTSAVLAGDIPSVPGPQPPPPGIAGTAPGEIPSVGLADQLSLEEMNALIAALSFLSM